MIASASICWRSATAAASRTTRSPVTATGLRSRSRPFFAADFSRLVVPTNQSRASSPGGAAFGVHYFSTAPKERYDQQLWDELVREPQQQTRYFDTIPVLTDTAKEYAPQEEAPATRVGTSAQKRYRDTVPVLVDMAKDDLFEITAPKWYSGSPRTSVLIELNDSVGVLHQVLKLFCDYGINITRIESRPSTQDFTGGDRFDFFVDFQGSVGEASVDLLLEALEARCERVLILDERTVPWFPRHASELDLICNRTLDAGSDLESDHPGFRDGTYRARREELASLARRHVWNRPIATIRYTPEEIATWGAVWERMEGLWDKYACKEYKTALELMKRHCGYGSDTIPQQRDISSFLKNRTGFRMRPVAGLLSSRDFLNGLAFRVFFSTQYIRHHSKPLYTPEPDICHELLGHAPMFANTDFADFSQHIGLASLGASNEDVEKLARCYWHSVEFGLCREADGVKAYGAGLLSSFGEIEHACAPREKDDGNGPEIREWDPAAAASQDFPITTYQPVYFLAESLQDAKDRQRAFCEDLKRPFFPQHNAQNDTVHIDRQVKRESLE